jgi:hypothetical protein
MRLGRSLFVFLNSNPALVCESEREMNNSASLMSCHRLAKISPRRAPLCSRTGPSHRVGALTGYRFDAPGSSRTNRKQIRAAGFATKKAATDAETDARVEAQRKYQLSLQGPAPLPKTLGDMLSDYLAGASVQPRALERYPNRDILALRLHPNRTGFDKGLARAGKLSGRRVVRQ